MNKKLALLVLLASAMASAGPVVPIASITGNKIVPRTLSVIHFPIPTPTATAGLDGFGRSAGSSTYSNATNTPTQVNSNITLVTGGRPVMMRFAATVGTSGWIAVQASGSTSATAYGQFRPYVDGSPVEGIEQMEWDNGGVSSETGHWPCSALNFIVFPSGGTHTFSVFAAAGFSSSGQVLVRDCQLQAFEM